MKTLFFPLLFLSILSTGCGRHMPSPFRGSGFMPRVSIDPRKAATGPMDLESQAALHMSKAIFSGVMAPGGVWLWQEDYEPGQWTSWEAEGAETELAFLKDAGEGKQWWRIRLIPDDEDDLAYEALIDRESFSARRIRAAFGEDEPFEVPLSEMLSLGERGEPDRLKPEFLASIVTGVETVSVPAGIFRSKRASYEVPEGGKLELWLNDSVPGGVVRYRYTSPEGESLTGNLTGFGDGAVTLLGSY